MVVGSQTVKFDYIAKKNDTLILIELKAKKDLKKQNAYQLRVYIDKVKARLGILVSLNQRSVTILTRDSKQNVARTDVLYIDTSSHQGMMELDNLLSNRLEGS